MADNQALVLTFGGDVTQLDKAMDRSLSKTLKTMAAMEARVSAFEKHLAGIGKSISGGNVVNEVNNIGNAVDKVFDSTRLAVIEAGASRIGLFGSALKPLGVLGIAAAAGIAATAIAFEQATKAADWAEDLEKTAKALALTTTTLQEYDFVASATGIANDKMRESLSGVSKTIASVETGLTALKRGPSVKLFEAILGDSDPAKAAAALRALGGVEQVLPKILDYAAKLSDTQRIGVAKALKMDPEVLNSLVDGRDKLSGLIAEAHRYGLIVDEDVIRRSADAAEQMHVTSTVIDDELRVAFLGLTGDAATASNALLGVVDRIKDIIAGSRNALGPIQDMLADIARIPASLPHAADEHQDAIGQGVTDFASKYAKYLPFAFGPPGIIAGTTLLAGDVADNGHRLNLAGRGGNSLGAAGGIRRRTPMGETIAGDLSDAPLAPADPGHGHADHGSEEIGEAQERYLEALARAATSLDEAHLDRLKLIQQRYMDAVQKATTQKGLKPDERSTLIATAGLTRDADVVEEGNNYQRSYAEHVRSMGDQIAKYTEQQLQAQADITGSLSDRQTLERQQLADQQSQAQADLNERIATDKQTTTREAADLLAAQSRAQLAERAAQDAGMKRANDLQALDFQAELLRSTGEELKDQLDLATTRQQRKKIEQQIIDNDRAIAEAQLAKDTIDRHLTPDQVAARETGIKGTYGAQTQLNNQTNASPLAQFAQPGPSVGDQVQSQAVSAMEALNSGLAEAITQGKSLKDTLKSALQSFEQGILKDLLEDTEKAAVRSIFGFADGGRVPGAGGPRADDKLANVSSGEFIVNAPATSRNLPMLEAINSGHPMPHYADGGMVGRVASTGRINPRGGGLSSVSVANHYDLRGVTTDGELDRRLAASEQRTRASVIDTVQRSQAGWNAQYQGEYR